MEYSNLFVCLMGMGTVFIGLAWIVLLVTAMSAIVRKGKKPAPITAAPVQAQPETGNKAELLAAISAAIAEDMGTDVSAIRIVSIKKV